MGLYTLPAVGSASQGELRRYIKRCSAWLQPTLDILEVVIPSWCFNPGLVSLRIAINALTPLATLPPLPRGKREDVQELLQSLMQATISARPSEPLPYMIRFLEKQVQRRELGWGK